MAVAVIIPWFVLSGCLYASMTTGIFYTFSMYSQQLKDQFHLSQGALTRISTYPYFLGLISFFWGILVRRLGCRVVLLGGGLLVSIMTTFQWAIARTYIAVPEDAVSWT